MSHSSTNTLAYHHLPILSPSTLDELLNLYENQYGSANIQTLILLGSYARGEATPYSDIDLCFLIKDMPNKTKQHLFRENCLVSLMARSLDSYRTAITQPEQAIFTVPNLRSARILLDPNGKFHEFQQTLASFSWAPLQATANRLVSYNMMRLAEHTHKVLSALHKQNPYWARDMLHILCLALPENIGIQRGVLQERGTTYAQQIQESVGINSNWSHYHRTLSGTEPAQTTTEARSIAALHLFVETATILWPILETPHREVVSGTLATIKQFLAHQHYP